MRHRFTTAEVIRLLDNPVHKTGGITVLYGNLAPDGAVVKSAGVSDEMMIYTGKARVFNSEDAAMDAILGGLIREGDVIVVQVRRAERRPGNA